MSLGERLSGLSPRERRFLVVGAAALVLFVIILATSLGGGRGADERVELAQASPPVSAPDPASAPPSSPTVFTAPPAPSPEPPAAAAGALMLYGVVEGGPGGGAAIIGPAGGSQRAVKVGRPVAAGMILKEVGPGYAVLSGPSGDVRLELPALPVPRQ